MNTSPSQDFARLVELQQKHNKLTTDLDSLEVAMNISAQAAAENSAASYVVLQEDLAKTEEEIKRLFKSHPEWRGELKSVKTPFGLVQQHSVTELVIANPAATVVH
jgi:hypothetical protein